MDSTATPPTWFTDALTAEARAGEVVVDGARVAFRVWDAADRADGPGVLLVHGGAAHSHWWDHIAPQLTPRHRVVALDLTGHGDSDKRDHYALEQWADELIAVVHAAQLGPAPVIVGHSMGGMVTYVAAHRHAAELGGIVVIDSPIHRYTPDQEETRGAALARPQKIYPDVATALAHFRLVPPQPTTLPYVMDHVARESLGRVTDGYSWKFDPTLVRRDGSDALAARGPQCRLAYYRCADGIIDDEMFDDMRARFGPSALVTTLPHTGHHPMADQPLMLVALLRATVAAWEAADS